MYFHKYRFVPSYAFLIILTLLFSGCATTYYSAMEKAGIHKRDIMVDRVEEARDAQSEAQEELKDALEQFASVIELRDTDLKRAYEHLTREFDDCLDAAEEVSERIDKVESVSKALFKEWEQELDLYQNRDLQRTSKQQLAETKSRYQAMLSSMHSAERSMEPVLTTFQDNVLFLKHNLNAQAIGNMQREFSSLEKDIDGLIGKMNVAIEESNQFIARMK